MRYSKKTWALMATGTLVTIGTVCFGIAALRHRALHEMPPETMVYFMDDARLRVPLSQAEVFTSLAVGYAGHESPLTVEFLGVLRDQTADDKLVELVEHGASGARLYGLCGLRIVESERQAAAASAVGRDRRDVAFIEGCSVSISKTRDAALSSKFKSVCDGLKDNYHDAALPNPALNPTGLRPAG